MIYALILFACQPFMSVSYQNVICAQSRGHKEAFRYPLSKTKNSPVPNEESEKTPYNFITHPQTFNLLLEGLP